MKKVLLILALVSLAAFAFGAITVGSVDVGTVTVATANRAINQLDDAVLICTANQVICVLTSTTGTVNGTLITGGVVKIAMSKQLDGVTASASVFRLPFAVPAFVGQLPMVVTFTDANGNALVGPVKLYYKVRTSTI